MPTNIFSKRMQEKTNQELVDIVKDYKNYQKEAVKAVIYELKKRGILEDSFSDLDFEKSYREIQNSQIERKENSNNAIEKTSKGKDWSWLPKDQIVDQLGFYSFYLIITLVLALPYFDQSYVVLVAILICLIPFWQLNIQINKNSRRSSYLHTRGIYAISVTVILGIRKYFLFPNSNPIEKNIALFFVLMIISGIISLIPYHVPLKYFHSNKFYFLRKIRIFIPLAFLVLIPLVIMEEDWFKSEKVIRWDSHRPLTSDDFRGYPDLYTEYDAVINSFLESHIDDDGNLIYLDGVCSTKNTWINPWDKDGYFLIQHEQYHFNITEMVARMARKKLYDTLKNGADSKAVISIIQDHVVMLDSIQAQYDEETNHSTISVKQGYWQYHIDSMIAELDPYWSSAIFRKIDTTSAVSFYRNINVNDKEEIVLMHPLMPGEEIYTSHYRFVKNNKDHVEELTYYENGNEEVDSFFEVFKTKIKVENGVIVWSFFDVNDNPISNNRGYHKKRIKRDDGKFGITFENSFGERVVNNNGVGFIKGSTDSLERKNSEIYFDLNSQQIMTKKGLFKVLYEFEGNETFANRKINLNRHGERLEDVNGVCEKYRIHDENGELIYSSDFNIQSDYVNKNGYAIKKHIHNELGAYVGLEYLDEEGNPAENSNGVSMITWSEDRFGNINRKSTYNSNGVLKEIDEVATFYKQYDSSGNLILWADYGSGDNLYFDNNGYGKVKYKYDSLGRRTEIHNFNGYDYPIGSDGSSAVQLEIDDTINMKVITKNLDMFMEPDTSKTGVHYYENFLNENDDLIESRYYDLNGNLNAETQGVAVFKYKYDKNSNKIESRFYDENGRLAPANQGVSINRYTYDEKNRTIERSYYDSLNQLALFDGIARKRWKHDKFGNEIETKFFGVNDQLLDSGIAIIRKEFDLNRNLITQINLDNNEGEIDGEFALTNNQFDKWNNHTSQSFYHLDNSPAVDENGVHRYEYKYHKGNLVSKRYLNESLKLKENLSGVARIEIALNKRGNEAEKRFFGDDNKLANDTTGISIMKYEYDLFDRTIKEEFWDASMERASRFGRYCTIVYERDRAGNILTEAYYDSDGNLAGNSKGNALIIAKYYRNGFSSDKTYLLEEANEYLGENEGLKYLLTYRHESN